jgi:urate oxidase
MRVHLERKNEEPMKKISKSKGDILPDYDFSTGVRGKYAESYAKGSNVVVLDSASAGDIQSQPAPTGRPSHSPGQRPGKR